MPELVHRDTQARSLLDELGDLATQGSQAFVPATQARKEPWLIGTAQQHVQMVVDVVIDQRRQLGVKDGLQANAVLTS